MNNRFFIGISLVVLGFFLYAFSLVQGANNAKLDIVSAQQDKLMQMMQQKMAHRMMPQQAWQMPAPAAAAVPSADVAVLQTKIQALESRLAELENDAKPIITQIKSQQKAYEEQRKQMEEAMKKVYQIDIGTSPVRGSKNAQVTLVEFTDFQCPFCSRFHSISEDLLKSYPDKLKFVIKNFPLPFHQQAKPGAKATLAAGLQGKYWEMVDAIFKDNSSLSDQKFEELAKAIGLNVDRFRKDLKDKDAQFEKTIQEDMDLAQKVSVHGTPTFYLNGKMTMPDPTAMKAAVDGLLKAN